MEQNRFVEIFYQYTREEEADHLQYGDTGFGPQSHKCVKW
jgi:hypothetical protein